MVDTHDPEKVLNEAEKERKESIENAQQALKFFLEEVDGLIEWEDVESELADYMDVGKTQAKRALAQIVGDIVDPVQQIGTGEDRFVGIIGFSEFPDAGAYGYTHYSDTHGRRNRVVCAKCVQEKESDSDVAHATQGEGTNAEDATWEQLLNKVTSHYANAHESAPEQIDIGASLVSGTTMGGNQAWHQGNVTGGSNITIGTQDVSIEQGPGSGLNADKLDGDEASSIGGASGFAAAQYSPNQKTLSFAAYVTTTLNGVSGRAIGDNGINGVSFQRASVVAVGSTIGSFTTSSDKVFYNEYIAGGGRQVSFYADVSASSGDLLFATIEATTQCDMAMAFTN